MTAPATAPTQLSVRQRLHLATAADCYCPEHRAARRAAVLAQRARVETLP